MKNFVRYLNKELTEEYHFKLDCIHYLDIYNESKLPNYKFFGYADSILNDITIVPEKDKMVYICTQKEIIKWINREIFTRIITDLQTKGKVNVSTLDVKVRIALCKIDNTNLTLEQKREWFDTLKEVYKNRLKGCLEYYLKEIVKLPF